MWDTQKLHNTRHNTIHNTSLVSNQYALRYNQYVFISDWPMKNKTCECPNSLPATVDSCFALIGVRQHSVADSESLDFKVIKAGSMTCGFNVGKYAGHRWTG